MRRLQFSIVLIVLNGLFVGCDIKSIRNPKRSSPPGAILANAKKLSIGTQGATIEVTDDWRRKQLNRDFGKDQFYLATDGGYGMAVMEITESLDSEDEIYGVIDEWISGIELVGNDADARRLPFKKTNDLDHASVQLRVTVRSIRLSYDIYAIGRDGLYYVFLTWTSPSRASSLRTKNAGIARSLALPGPNTDWGRSTEATLSTVNERGYKLTFPYQRSIFAELHENLGDAFYGLVSHGAVTVCYLFFVDGYTSEKAASESIYSVLKLDYPEIMLKSRARVRAANKEALQSVYSTDDPKTPFNILSTVIPMSDDTFLEIRCVTSSKLESKLKHLNPLVDQLVIESTQSVDAFPEVAATTDQESTQLGPQHRQLLEASETVGTFDQRMNAFSVLSDGSILGIGTLAIMNLLEGDQNAKTLLQFDEWNANRSAAYCNGQLLAADNSGMVTQVKDGVAQAYDLQGHKLFAAGTSDLFIVRRSEAPDRLKLLGSTSPSKSQLIFRSVDGTETSLGQFHEIQRIANSSSGDSVLVHHLMVTNDSVLTRVHLKTGSQSALPNWETISHLAEAETGWLVNGKPNDGLVGLYLIDESGEHELLISGTDFTGIRITQDALICASQLARDAGGENVGGSHVYSCPLDIVRQHGPGCSPFNGRLIQEIARQAADSLDFDTNDRTLFTNKRQVEAFLKEAQKISEQTTGYPLPRSVDGFDRMIDWLDGREDVSQEGLLLLSLNLAMCLLESGAEWVKSDESLLAIKHSPSDDLNGDNPFAVAYMVDDIVMSTLYDSDGWWQPASSIIRNASGRTVLLGSDPGKLQEELKSRNRDDLDELIAQSEADVLIKLLKANAGNLRLRQHVYDTLLQVNRLDVCELAVNDFARLSDPKLLDVKYRAVVRFQDDKHQSDPAETIRELRTSIEKFPQEPVFYLILGAAYEESKVNSKLEKAKRCYSQATELQGWGSVYEQATNALNRLSDSEQQE